MRVGKFPADLHLCMVSSGPQSIPKRHSLSEQKKVELRKFHSLPRVIQLGTVAQTWVIWFSAQYSFSFFLSLIDFLDLGFCALVI